MHIIPTTFSIVRKPSIFTNLFKCRNLNRVAAMSADKFVLENPELIEKRRAVVKYLNEPKFELTEKDSAPEKIGDYNINVLYDNKVSEILELCGDDLYKIDSALGLYGLATYAQVSPETIMKNRNPEISEIGYDKDSSFRCNFYGYLLANENGKLLDLYSRFGKMGAKLYEDCSMLGFVKTGY